MKKGTKNAEMSYKFQKIDFCNNRKKWMIYLEWSGCIILRRGDSQTAGSSWQSQSRCTRWASPTVAGCISPAALARYLQTAWSRNRPPGSPDRRCWSSLSQWWRWGTTPARRNNWTRTPSPCQGSTWEYGGGRGEARRTHQKLFP